MDKYDVVIVGAGIAGTGLGWALSPHARVLVIEAEHVGDYHSTGRSAAFYAETYGGTAVQPLTSASKAFFHNPPAGFTDKPLVSPRGVLHIFRENQRASAEALYRTLDALPDIRMQTREEIIDRVPILGSSQLAGGIEDPGCLDIDVANLHQSYQKGIRKNGSDIFFNHPFIHARKGKVWCIKAGDIEVEADVLVNAAGAWADDIAQKSGISPLGFEPKRRTIITIAAPGGMNVDPHWPLVMDVDETFYFKPEGKGLLVSPADERPSLATDAQPEIEDVAVAADRFSASVGVKVERILSKWAGLRTFAPDRKPVIGFSGQSSGQSSDQSSGEPSGFFWSAGQGGWGIQTSPAWNALAASLILGRPMPDHLKDFEVDPGLYQPDRFKSG